MGLARRRLYCRCPRQRKTKTDSRLRYALVCSANVVVSCMSLRQAEAAIRHYLMRRVRQMTSVNSQILGSRTLDDLRTMLSAATPAASTGALPLPPPSQPPSDQSMPALDSSDSSPLVSEVVIPARPTSVTTLPGARPALLSSAGTTPATVPRSDLLGPPARMIRGTNRRSMSFDQGALAAALNLPPAQQHAQQPQHMYTTAAVQQPHRPDSAAAGMVSRPAVADAGAGVGGHPTFFVSAQVVDAHTPPMPHSRHQRHASDTGIKFPPLITPSAQHHFESSPLAFDYRHPLLHGVSSGTPQLSVQQPSPQLGRARCIRGSRTNRHTPA